MNPISKIIANPSAAQTGYFNAIKGFREENTTLYLAYEIKFSDLNLDLLEKSISYLVTRHESLRTVFAVLDGNLKQIILPYHEIYCDIEYYEAKDEEEFIKFRTKAYDTANKKFFKIDQGPLLHFNVINLNGNYTFSLLVHHILCDASSAKIIEVELLSTYNSYTKGEDPDLSPLKFQLRDYCNHQNKYISENRLKLRDFWNERLNGFMMPLQIDKFYKGYGAKQMSLDRPSAPNYQNTDELTEALNGDALMAYKKITGDDFLAIRTLANESKCTISTIIYTSFYLLFSIYLNKSKILFVTVLSDRAKSEYKNLIGCMLGAAYLPIEILPEHTISDLTKSILKNLINGAKNKIFNHDFLGIDESQLRISCDMCLNYIPVPKPIDSLEGGLEQDREHKCVEGVFYGLYSVICEYTDGLTIALKYNKEIFHKDLIDDFNEFHDSILSALSDQNNVQVKNFIASRSQKF